MKGFLSVGCFRKEKWTGETAQSVRSLPCEMGTALDAMMTKGQANGSAHNAGEAELGE